MLKLDNNDNGNDNDNDEKVVFDLLVVSTLEIIFPFNLLVDVCVSMFVEFSCFCSNKLGGGLFLVGLLVLPLPLPLPLPLLFLILVQLI